MIPGLSIKSARKCSCLVLQDEIMVWFLKKKNETVKIISYELLNKGKVNSLNHSSFGNPYLFHVIANVTSNNYFVRVEI